MMKLKLLNPHIIEDRWCPAGTVLDPAPPGYQATPLMEGLRRGPGRSGLCQAQSVGALPLDQFAIMRPIGP